MHTSVGYAMAISGGADLMMQAALFDAIRGWCPLVVCSSDFDEILNEFTNLIVVNSDQFGMVGSAEVEARDQAEDLGDAGGDDKDVGAACNNVCDLDVELLVVLVEEAARNGGVNVIEGDDLSGGEESVEDETDDSCQSVLCEEIESVINADEMLDLGSVIACRGGDNTKDDTGPQWDKARAGGGSHETGNRTGAETNHGVLFLDSVIEQTPDNTTGGCGDAGVEGSIYGSEVGAKGRTGIETDPSEPEHECAEGDEGDVVWTEVDELALVSTSDDPRIGQTTDTRADFYRSSTGEIEDAIFKGPAIDVPNPACDGGVNEGDPEENEKHCRHQTTTLGDGTHQDCNGDGAEFHLEKGVKESGDEG